MERASRRELNWRWFKLIHEHACFGAYSVASLLATHSPVLPHANSTVVFLSLFYVPSLFLSLFLIHKFFKIDFSINKDVSSSNFIKSHYYCCYFVHAPSSLLCWALKLHFIYPLLSFSFLFLLYSLFPLLFFSFLLFDLVKERWQQFPSFFSPTAPFYNESWRNSYGLICKWFSIN